jgi:hypothetical protein
MIIYNVTIAIDKRVEKEWVSWMKTRHIPEVLATGHFTSYRMCKILHEDDETQSFAVQYFCESMDIFMQYNQQHAPRLQADHKKHFPDQFVAIRTLMEII